MYFHYILYMQCFSYFLFLFFFFVDLYTLQTNSSQIILDLFLFLKDFKTCMQNDFFHLNHYFIFLSPCRRRFRRRTWTTIIWRSATATKVFRRPTTLHQSLKRTSNPRVHQLPQTHNPPSPPYLKIAQNLMSPQLSWLTKSSHQNQNRNWVDHLLQI